MLRELTQFAAQFLSPRSYLVHSQSDWPILDPSPGIITQGHPDSGAFTLAGQRTIAVIIERISRRDKMTQHNFRRLINFAFAIGALALFSSVAHAQYPIGNSHL